MAVWLLLVLMLGGSSRGDNAALMALVPVSVFVVIWLAVVRGARGVDGIAWPIGVVLVLVTIGLLQLIPLPPAIWASLGGREPLVAVDRLIGTADVWRPISLSPVRTWSAVFSLSVPLAAILLYARMRRSDQLLVVPLLIGAAVISAVFAIAQAVTPGAEFLYFYRYTNLGEPVGLFANRNHNAVFLSTSLIWMGYAASHADSRYMPPRNVRLALASAAGVVIVAILINASRAGLVSAALALVFAALIAVCRSMEGPAGGQARARVPMRVQLAGRQWAIPGSALAAAVITGGVAVLSLVLLLSARLPAIDRVARTGMGDELRLGMIPALLDMAWRHLPFGTGLGVFDLAYRRYEADALLMENYINNAHDDWLQLVIEGGVPLAVLAIIASGWVLVRGGQLIRLGGKARGLALCIWGSWLIFGLASLVDYPLRTPMMMAVTALLGCILATAPTRGGGQTQ